jgi:hypothetical protein
MQCETKLGGAVKSPVSMRGSAAQQNLLERRLVWDNDLRSQLLNTADSHKKQSSR